MTHNPCNSPEYDEIFIHRLLSRRRVTDNGCWEYTGYIAQNGYGQISYRGVRWYVHNIFLRFHLGINYNPKLLNLHHCDNPLCFNPEHLFQGTHQDNMTDAKNKGRLYNQNKYKTKCKRGHSFTPENTIPKKNGGRNCRACKILYGLLK